MGVVTSILVFVIVWWLSLFFVLPFGSRTQSDEGKIVNGTEPGAPADFKIVNKVLITTAVAIVIWLIIFTLVSYGVFSFRPSDSNPWG